MVAPELKPALVNGRRPRRRWRLVHDRTRKAKTVAKRGKGDRGDRRRRRRSA